MQMQMYVDWSLRTMVACCLFFIVIVPGLVMFHSNSTQDQNSTIDQYRLLTVCFSTSKCRSATFRTHTYDYFIVMCVCVCIYICIYIYTHTYIHMIVIIIRYCCSVHNRFPPGSLNKQTYNSTSKQIPAISDLLSCTVVQLLDCSLTAQLYSCTAVILLIELCNLSCLD